MVDRKQETKHGTMTWEKAKDIIILGLIGLAIKVFSTNMSDLNKSVQELNIKVGSMMTSSNAHDRDIENLKERVRLLEIEEAHRRR